MDKFRDLPYQRPDLTQVKKDFSKLLKQFKSASNIEEADDAFLSCMKLAEGVFTENTIASIRNTIDTSDEFYDGEIKFFNREIPKLMLLIKKAGKALMASPYRSQLEDAKEKAFTAGVSRGIDPFMTLSFMALPVIPTLRITTRGVYDVNSQQYV